MPFMGGVQMPIVEIVDVITVRNGDVSALGAVNVFMFGVDHAVAHRAFVPVILVLVVEMPVVDVVDMTVVLDGRMSTVGAVDVGVSGVLTHDFSVP